MDRFLKQCAESWEEIHNQLFPSAIPEIAEWLDINDIITVLNLLGRYPNTHHTHFPRSGGHDLIGAKESFEQGHIEINFGSNYIVLPEKLIFRKLQPSTVGDFQWNYFELLTKKMLPSGVEGQGDQKEELTELSPGQYVPREAWSEGEYNDEPIIMTARPISRVIAGGSYVIFTKSSRYIQDDIGYAGEHEKLGSAGFLSYITSLI